MNKGKKIIIILSLIWTLVLLTTVTYSWIARSWTPKVEYPKVSIATSGALVISINDKENREIILNELVGEEEFALQQVSSSDGINFVSANFNPILDNGVPVYDDDVSGKYIETKFHLKTQYESDVDIAEKKKGVFLDVENSYIRYDVIDNWELVFADNYNQSMTYEPGDLVKVDGTVYECLEASSNVKPGTDDTKWVAIEYANLKDEEFSKGAYLLVGTELYKARHVTTLLPTDDSDLVDNWELVIAKSYDHSKTFEPGDLVKVDEIIYECLVATSNVLPGTDDTKWIAIEYADMEDEEFSKEAYLLVENELYKARHVTTLLPTEDYGYGDEARVDLAIRISIEIKDVKTYIFCVGKEGDEDGIDGVYQKKAASLYSIGKEVYTSYPNEELNPSAYEPTYVYDLSYFDGEKDENGNDKFLFTIDSASEKEITVRIWLEGCDENCINEISGKKLSLALVFDSKEIVTNSES